jgi:hypothetical protein
MAGWPEASHGEDHGTESEYLEPGIAAVWQVPSASTVCSSSQIARHFVTCAKFTAALQDGCPQVAARRDPPGITISGTPSENAWAAAPRSAHVPATFIRRV